VAVNGKVSYDRLVAIAISYTFPSAPLVPDDYDVTFTYYDVDNDCVTIASSEELVDAIGQFPGVLRITADVKRKKNRPIPVAIPPAPPRVSRVEVAPGTSTPPSNGPTNVTAQLQSILESFVSILAAAVVALQSHVNPAPSVANSASTGEARLTTDAPTTTKAETKQRQRFLENIKKDIDRLKSAEPKQQPLDPVFIPDARPCGSAKVTVRATAVTPDTELTKDEPTKDEKPPAVERVFIHGRHTCDRCLSTPIVGKRFHATNLPDYDLCEKCMDGYKGREIQFEAVELGTYVETGIIGIERLVGS
jgi:Zinc finger, ZZ type